MELCARELRGGAAIGAILKGFSTSKSAKGEAGPAERWRSPTRGIQLPLGSVIMGCNGRDVSNLPFKNVMQALTSSPRPVLLSFAAPDLETTITFKQPASIDLGFRFEWRDEHSAWCVSEILENVPGQAQMQGVRAGWYW